MVMKIAQYLRNLHREEEGFTLIELLIVIAIIAVIAAIAIPMVASRIDDARESADKANERTLQGLVDQYYIDKGVYPAEAITGENDLGEMATGPSESDNWMDKLIEAKLLHEEGVENPYPGESEDGKRHGYYLKVVPGTKTDTWVGTVSSSTKDRWKEAETD